MEHTKKMILIDPRLIDKITTPKDRVLSSMEGGMTSILSDSSLSDDIKAKLFASAQTRYLTVDAPNPPPPTTATEPNKLITDDVMMSLPKTLQTKATRLFQHIKRVPDTSFNDKGELVVKGQTIPNSNATDLVNDLLRPNKKNAVGYKEFLGALKESNIPSDLIVEKKTIGVTPHVPKSKQLMTQRKTTRKSTASSSAGTIPWESYSFASPSTSTVKRSRKSDTPYPKKAPVLTWESYD